MRVCIYVQGHKYIGAMYGGQRSVLGVSFNNAPPYFLKQSLAEPGAQKFEESR